MNEKDLEIIKNNAVSESYLQNWYQDSIDNTIQPIWTNEHIEELYKDFYLIPKNANTMNNNYGKN